jgi:thioredoxin-like negative regulator of GroEL
MKQVLYFSAPWCNPCKILKPRLQPLRNQMPIVDINVDGSPETAQQWRVRNVPTIIVTDGTMEIGRLVGNAITPESITNLFNR